MKVPTLDFSLLLDVAEDHQRQASQDLLLDALSQLGFVKIVNHGIPESVIHEMLDWVRGFFILPPEIKEMTTEQDAGPVPYRGWIRLGRENAAAITGFVDGKPPKKVPPVDLKEVFDLGSSTDPLFQNLWPEEAHLPGFRKACESFYGRCSFLQTQLLSSIAKALGLDSNHFQTPCSQELNSLRLLHYPECDIQTLKTGTKRVSEHSDTSVLTLLFQDSIGGLEVEEQHCPGSFVPLPRAERAEIIVNIGDFLQRWSNGKLRSAVHRVVLPQTYLESTKGRIEDRYSIVYFGKPNRDAIVGAMPEFVDQDHSSKYDNVTAWEYIQDKYKYIFAKETQAPSSLQETLCET